MTPARPLAVAVLAAAAISALSATLAAQSASRFILARASGPDGQPLVGLAAEDFVVYEGATPREALNAAPAAYPVAILVDTTEAARAEFMTMRLAVRQFIDRLSGREVALYAFGDRAMRLVDFTRDTGKLQRSIDNLFAQPGAESHVLDAIIEAAKEIRRSESAVTLITVVSAGGNDQSNRTPRDVFDAVLASRSIVHVVEMRMLRASGRLTNVRGRRTATSDRAAEAALGLEELLRDLADRTEGNYNVIYSGSGYQSDLEALQRSLASEVIIEYESAADAAPAPLRLAARPIGATVRGIGLERAPR
jgi:von Willebrand factor type A domain